jgi:hypothetical protein
MRSACTSTQLNSNSQVSRTLVSLEHHWCGELFQPRETKGPLAVEIENAKIIGLVQTLHSNLEMPAISLLRIRNVGMSAK